MGNIVDQNQKVRMILKVPLIHLQTQEVVLTFHFGLLCITWVKNRLPVSKSQMPSLGGGCEVSSSGDCCFLSESSQPIGEVFIGSSVTGACFE